MKDIYVTPETEVIRFNVEDIITTSKIGDDDIFGGDNDTPVKN